MSFSWWFVSSLFIPSFTLTIADFPGGCSVFNFFKLFIRQFRTSQSNYVKLNLKKTKSITIPTFFSPIFSECSRGLVTWLSSPGNKLWGESSNFYFCSFTFKVQKQFCKHSISPLSSLFSGSVDMRPPGGHAFLWNNLIGWAIGLLLD